MITFDVYLNKKSFKRNEDPVDNGLLKTPESILKGITNIGLEQVSDSGNLINAYGNVFVAMVQNSFGTHRHLIIDPDIIWQTIESGLANHIKKNAEELRPQFVDFEGKQTIDVRRDNFIKGGKNDWEGCFDEFSGKIGEFIGKKKDLIVSNFSTTDKLKRVSSEIILMDAMSEYFNYTCTTCCGIPSVTLEGTVEDWENIKDRVNNLDEFGLDWWTKELRPVLDGIISSAKGNVDIDFWTNFYSEGGGSGGPFIDGHIIKFFPYIGPNFIQNSFDSHHLTLSTFPLTVSSVPFVWNYHNNKYPMQFTGGAIGIKPEDKGSLRAGFGWSVQEAAVPLCNYALNLIQEGMIVHDMDGNSGKIIVVEFFKYTGRAASLDGVVVDFGDGNVKTYSRYDFQNLCVKVVNHES